MIAGTDPMTERKAKGEAQQKEVKARLREAENSFENVAREWWKWWLIGKSPRHADTTMRRMEADVFPAYGHKSINEVTAADVRQLMIAVEKRDARDVAKRIHETTSQFSLCNCSRHCNSEPGRGFQAEGHFGRGSD